MLARTGANRTAQGRKYFSREASHIQVWGQVLGGATKATASPLMLVFSMCETAGEIRKSHLPLYFLNESK